MVWPAVMFTLVCCISWMQCIPLNSRDLCTVSDKVLALASADRKIIRYDRLNFDNSACRVRVSLYGITGSDDPFLRPSRVCTWNGGSSESTE